MRSLAYFWDVVKLEKIGKCLRNRGGQWAAAADLVLWCLQGDASRRPASIAEVFNHKFFDASAGALRFLASTEETWSSFVRRQAADLHAAIE